MQVSQPTIEHHEPGRLGIGESTPRLSWRVTGASAGYEQVAAEVELTRVRGGATSVELAELPGNDQVLVPWPFAELSSRDRVSIRVRVSDGEGWSGWSDSTAAEIGLLDPGDWSARFVGPAWAEDPGPHRRPARVRHEFEVPEDVATARLYLSAHGVAEVEINGERVGDEELTPGWTSYRHRLRYATFDISGHLRTGKNSIGVWLGDGWWRGRLGYANGRLDIYGERLAVLAQLEVELEDGRRVTVSTDEAWAAGMGPILRSDLYDGEHFDAREHDEGWSTAGWDAAGWTPVELIHEQSGALVAPTGPPCASSRRCSRFGSNSASRDAGCSTSVRTTPGDSASAPMDRPEPRSACVTPRSSSMATSTPSRCARQRRPMSSSSMARRSNGNRGLRSMATATPRSRDGTVS